MKKTNKKKLFVTFHDSLGGNMKIGKMECLKGKEYKRDYDVLFLEYLAECGDISNLPFSNDAYYQEYYDTDAETAYKKYQANIKKIQAIGKDTEIEIFVVKENANGLCNLYYIAEHFKGFSNVSINYCHKEMKQDVDGVYFFDFIVDERFALTAEIIEEYSKKWEALRKSNALMRICKGGEIVEFSLEEAQDIILPFFSDKYQKLPRISVDIQEKYPFISYDCFRCAVDESVKDKTLIKSHFGDLRYAQDDFYHHYFKLNAYKTKNYAMVKFIGNEEEYLIGKYCAGEAWLFCNACQEMGKHKCKRPKIPMFVRNKEYKAYFLDYCQGVRDVLEVEAETGDVETYIPLSDFEIVSDEYNVLNEKHAIVVCINTNNQQDLTQGKHYKALKQNGDCFYVLDDSSDCYSYPKEYFEIIEDKDGILNDNL